MKPFTQTADTLDQELADKIDGILAAHGEDPTQLVGILLDVEAAVERHYIPEAAAYYVAERLLSCHASGGPLSERPERGERAGWEGGISIFPLPNAHPP